MRSNLGSSWPRPAAVPTGRRVRRFASRALLFLAAASLAPLTAAQPQLAQGVLLVATPDIGDPSWSRTVVLLLHHDSNGTLGVAINRPTHVEPGEIDSALDLEGYSGRVFRGGPVGPTQIVFLVRDPPPGALGAAPLIVDGIRASGDLSAVSRLVELGSVDDGALRIFAGHVEWASGQLSREIADGLWTVTTGSAPRVFSPQPETLWERLRHAGDELLVEGGARGASPAGFAGTSAVPASDVQPVAADLTSGSFDRSALR